jgi:murein DD-endopeptidase MepM/ murein hydrolase activator NlpD
MRRLSTRERLLAAATTTVACALAGSLSLPGFAGPAAASAEGISPRLEPAAMQAAGVPDPVFPLLAAPRYGDGLGASRGHEGQDLFAPAGTAEVAVDDAVVLEAAAGYNGGRGNYVSIYSSGVDRTYNYFHMLSAPLVAPGQRVHAGQRLGELGCSGSCWGDHLHFEVRQGRNPYGPVLDPAPFLRSLPPAARMGLAQRRAVRSAAGNR